MRIQPRSAVMALAVGAALTVTAIPGTALAAEPVRGENRVLVAVVGFDDATFPDERLVMEKAGKSYFDGQKSLAGYYSKMSQGQFTYVPAVDGKVVGPYHLDLPQNPCDSGKVRDATRKALEADGYVEKEDYDSLSIIQPGEGSSCDWAGLGSVPGPNTWVSLSGDEVSEALLVHEFGHNQGYGHHARYYCPEGDVSRCAEDGYSHKTPMGSGGSVVGLDAPELIHSGWLGAGQVRAVDRSGAYDLVPLHGDAAGTRALDIPMGDDRLVVEYRHPTDFPTLEGNLDSPLEGVYAYRVTDGDYAKSVFLDPTPEVGTGDEDAVTTLTDREDGVTIKVVRSGGGGATVAVGLNGEPASGAAAPNAATPNAAAPSATAPAAGGPSPQTRREASEPVSEKGTDAGSTAKPAASPATTDLAATGGSTTTPYLMAGGAGLVVLGVAAVLGTRRPGGRNAAGGDLSWRSCRHTRSGRRRGCWE